MHTVSTVRLLCTLLLVLIVGAPSLLPAATAPSPYVVEVADVGNSKELAASISAKGFNAVIPPRNIWVVDQQSNCAVWIGRRVPLEMLRVVLPEAMRANRYLRFFYVVGERGEKPPVQVDNTVHIGGSMEAALVKQLKVIDREELLETLAKVRTIAELHDYLKEKNRARDSAPEPAFLPSPP